MIWRVVVDLKQIHAQQRNYSWPRPDTCPRCQSWRVWGHGYVFRYFEGFAEALPLKCYRCPDCSCVITSRPASHLSRIHCSLQTIHSHLRHRLTYGCWPVSVLPRSRLRHWLANLKRQVQAHLTNTWSLGLLTGFKILLLRDLIPVARVS